MYQRIPSFPHSFENLSINKIFLHHSQYLPLNEIFLPTVLHKQLEKGIYAIFQISNHWNHQRQKTANTSRSLGWEFHDKSVIYFHKKSEKISHRNCADSARKALFAQTKINVVSDPAAYFPKQIFNQQPLGLCLLCCRLQRWTFFELMYQWN